MQTENSTENGEKCAKQPIDVFDNLTSVMPLHTTLETVLQRMQTSEKLKRLTLQYRELLACGKKKEADNVKRSCPCFAVAGLFEGGRKVTDQTGWTGLSLVDVDDVPLERIEELRNRLMNDKHTLALYVTLSGQGLRVLYRIEGVGPELDRKNQEAYLSLFQWGNAYYERLLGVKADAACKNMSRVSGMAYDEQLYVNFEAVPFALSEVPVKKKTSRNADKRLLKAVEVIRRELRAQGLEYKEHSRNEYVMRMGYLFNAYGVQQDLVMKWMKKEFADYTGNLESVVKSCYTHTEEHGTRYLTSNRRNSQNQPVMTSDIEEFLLSQAAFRKNVVTNRVEVKMNGTQRWEPMTDRILNTMTCRISKQLGKVLPAEIHTVVTSEFAPLYNPFVSYFEGLKPWDGKDYIDELASTVHIRSCEHDFFHKYFKKWLVGMVASLLDEHTVNNLVLLLIGEQGSYKTSWISHLLPPELNRYFLVKMDLRHFDKDDYIALSENALICLEEMEDLSHTNSKLKAMVTLPVVSERAAYARFKENRPHLASFCGTSNIRQILVDLTGNRRFVPVEVERIDDPYTHAVNYEGVYSQVMALLKQGFVFHPTGKDTKELNRHNSDYEVPCVEKELVLSLFAKPDGKHKVVFLSTSDVLVRLNSRLKVPITTARLALVMKELGFERKRSAGIRGYLVVELNGEEVYERSCWRANHASNDTDEPVETDKEKTTETDASDERELFDGTDVE